MSFSEKDDKNQQTYDFGPEAHEVDPDDLKTEHKKKVEKQRKKKQRDKERGGLPRRYRFIIYLTGVLLIAVGFSVWGVWSIYQDRATFEVTSSGKGGNATTFECPVAKEEELERLQPDITQKKVDTKRKEVKQLGSELEDLKQRIDSMNVDRSSREEVKTYNQLVDTYNAKQKTYSQKKKNFEELRKTFNKDVKAYNAFLEKECKTPKSEE